jgi:hypothetical protein
MKNLSEPYDLEPIIIVAFFIFGVPLYFSWFHAPFHYPASTDFYSMLLLGLLISVFGLGVHNVSFLVSNRDNEITLYIISFPLTFSFAVTTILVLVMLFTISWVLLIVMILLWMMIFYLVGFLELLDDTPKIVRVGKVKLSFLAFYLPPVLILIISIVLFFISSDWSFTLLIGSLVYLAGMHFFYKSAIIISAINNSRMSNYDFFDSAFQIGAVVVAASMIISGIINLTRPVWFYTLGYQKKVMLSYTEQQRHIFTGLLFNPANTGSFERNNVKLVLDAIDLGYYSLYVKLKKRGVDINIILPKIQTTG